MAHRVNGRDKYLRNGQWRGPGGLRSGICKATGVLGTPLGLRSWQPGGQR